MDIAINAPAIPSMISGFTFIPLVSSSKNLNKPALDAGRGAFFFAFLLICENPYIGNKYITVLNLDNRLFELQIINKEIWVAIYSLKRPQIGVIGYNSGSSIQVSDATLSIAYEVGRTIAKRNAILISGGLGGVMESSCRGAKEHGGFTIGIVPHENSTQANDYCDAVICTGIGLSRDFIVAYSSDGIISVGGGVGTLIELCVGYMTRKPMVAMENTGGVSDIYGGKFLDERNRILIETNNDPASAVDYIISKITFG
jgi:uncharacterized protein (TIGR00725 family)